MKEFHNFVYKHIVTLKNHKRYIAMLTALSIFVSFMVPLILIEPADSMTKQRLMMLNKTSSGMAMVDNLNDGQTANNNYSPGQLSEVALLIGEFTPGDYETKLEWVDGCTTAAEVVEAAKREYFLGIASDFCVFLEGNLTITNADAEGRVAVGGNIYFDRDGDNNISNDYNYQLGSGDYQNMTALINTDNYQGISDFAHAIVAGSVENLNTLSSVGDDGGWTGREDANSLKKAYDKTQNPWKLLTVYFPEDEDLYKRFVVGDMANSSHITWPNGNASATAYQSNCSHDEISVNELAQFYQRDNLIDFGSVFDWLETQSEKLSIKRSTGTATWDGNTLNLVGNGNNGDETIYFNVEDWNNSVNKINISNVPDDANIVINCGETEDIKIGREGENDQFSTYFNGVAISRIDASGAETSYKNNSKKSEQILYNFYNVGKNDGDSEDADIYIDANFNGSILAPYANVKSGHSCGGHLSGALIAQTFRGGLEFGYRPYRGGTDILGSTAGYVVPFDKFVDDLIENNENLRLEGATFEIKEGDEIVDTWTSNGDSSSYVTFPTELDFTGGTDYNSAANQANHTYTVSEKSAPEGYAITTETYSVEVKETVDLDYLLPVDNGTIPTRATVEIKIFKNSDTDPVYSCKMIVEDTYSDNGIIQRIIAIDGTPKEYYVLDITNGEINSVGTPTDPSDLEYIWTVTANEEVDVQAMNVDGVDVLEDETDTSAENTEETTEEAIEETEEPTQSENQEETVEKTDPPIPTGLTIEYGKALNTVALPDGWTWNSPNDTVSETAGSTVSHKAKYTPSETSNYNAVEEDITLTVTKAQPTVNPEYNENTTYIQGNDLPTITISNGDTAGTISWVNSTAKLKYGKNVLAWKFTPDEGNNYEEATGEITITASAIPTNQITLEKGKQTAQKLSDGKHYYDPTSLMIMPLPNETPSFTNDYALVFEKVSGGNPLAGADIKLQVENSNGGFDDVTATDVPSWNWTDKPSSCSINIKDIDEGKIYKFYEVSSPNSEKYEIANPIYFKRDGLIIKYAENEAELGNENCTSITLPANHTITMDDKEIFGPKIKLLKVKEGTNTTLEGAQFELYAVSGDTLVYPLEGETKLKSDAEGEIDFTDVFKANPDNCNTEYIKNGYLIPGEYYLQETTAPNGYEAPTDKMYFVVNEDYTVVAEKVEKPDYIPITLSPESNVSGNVYQKFFVVDHNGNKLDSNNWNGSIGFADVEYVLIKSSTQPHFWRNDSSNAVTFSYNNEKEGYIATFNPPTNLSKIEIQHPSYNPGLEVTYVEIGVSGGAVYSTGEIVGGSTGSGGGNVTSYTIDNIVWGNNNNVTVKKLTFYYEDKEPISRENINVTTTNEYWHPFGLSDFDKNKVIGIEIEVGGSGTGMLKVQAPGDVWIWGAESDQWNPSYTTVSAGETYTLGVTELPTDDNEELPGDSNESGESNENQNGNSPLITVDDSSKTIKIGNVEKGAYTDITVKKEWADSENLYNTRPEKVIVQLYQTDENGTSSLFTATAKHPNTVELNSGNKWTYTWEDLPSKIGETDKHYTYTVVEETVSGYTASYENGTNEITITNTLISKDIPVEKKWLDYNSNETTSHPDSVTVRLQKHNGTGYVDVTGKTIVLSDDNGWKASFENLPNGSYQIVENVPTGWTPSYSNQRITIDNNTTTISTCVITNTQETGSLGVQKIWSGGSVRPQNITVNIYRTTTPPNSGTTGGDNNVDVIPPKNSKHETVTEDYARLLQYSLYFYDANMCGYDVEANSILNWRSACHTGDEVDGGFHDAGDHVMFGLPQGFTASTLGWTYAEYKETFDTLGLTKHYQVIMKEFCDFFYDAKRMNNGNVEILVQKGRGNVNEGDKYDHSDWCSPELQDDTYESGTKRSSTWVSDRGGNVAAQYAASLALYYHNFSETDSVNSTKYLDRAKEFYEFAKNKTNPYTVGNYGDSNSNDEIAWAAACLYLATGEQSYSNDCKSKLETLSIEQRGHFWGEPTLGAAIIYVTRIDPTDTAIKGKVTNYLDQYCSGSEFRRLDSQDWGNARHNTLLQLTAITYDKYQQEPSYTEWCKNQMSFLLGNNTINTSNGVCFVTGFKDGDSDASNDDYLPQFPHHRAASGYSGWNEFNDAKEKGTNTQYKYTHALIGALVGGPQANNSYNDNINDTKSNEVALDYNAGLVGAAAALYSVYKTGNTVTKEVMVDDGLVVKDGRDIYEQVAYDEYLESQQARTANIEYNAVGPVNLSKLSFKRNAVSVLNNNTVEMMYPAYTTFGGIVKGKEVVFNTEYQNITKIEIDFTAVALPYNTPGIRVDVCFNKSSNGVGGGGEGTNGTITVKPTDWSGTTVDYIKISDCWGLESGSINEIRFYYEGTGPSITINNAPTTALKVGATHSLTATGVDSISWSSSSDKVSVENGNVTIKGYPEDGVATITAFDTSNEQTYAQITINVLPMTITLNSASISKGGTSDVIFTNAPDGEGWTYSYDYSPNDGGGLTIKNGVITANKSGEYTITATVSKGEITASATANLTVTSNFDAKFDGNTIEKTIRLSAFEDDVEVIVYNAEGGVTYSSNRDDLISIDQNTGTITLNPDAVIEESTPITITATDNSNNPKTLTLTIVPDITITSNDEDATININDELLLTANNLIGNTATWKIIEGTDVIEFVTQNVQQLAAEPTETSNIENGSAQITVKGKGYGTAIVEVIDAAGGSAQYTIKVEIVAVEPDFTDLELENWSATLTITSANDWSATMANLPKYDANGNLYYYYIEEVMTNGDHIAVSGGKYVPVSYINGTNLNSDKTLAVTNAFVEVDEQGTLPSTGGSGVKTYYYFGGALMLLGIAGFTGLKRRERKRREE